MRTTCSLYIDAGYLLAAAATRVAGTSLRNGIHVDYAALISALVADAEERTGMPVLRVHWYDSARNGVPDTQQERIGELSKVKLRLGRFGVDGQQKGVDLRIGLDLVAHARNDASDVFFLVSGDDDLTEAVEEAQVHGVQVVVLGVPDSNDKPHGVSRHLIRASDELAVLPGSLIDKVVMRVEVPQQPEPVNEPAVPVSPAVMPKVAPGKPSPPPVPGPLSRPAAAHAAPRVALAYSGTTGGPSHVMPGYEADDDLERYDEAIDDVIKRVLIAFRLSATEGDQMALKRGRPSIPRDIDRALLVDLSDALDMPDITDAIRYRLRERFWEQVDD